METINENVKNTIENLEKEGREIDAMACLNDRILLDFNITGKYEVSNAIGLFLNFDIKGAKFDDMYWFATKEKGCITIASYYYEDGRLVGFARIEEDEWYSEVRPFIKCYINGCEKLHGIATSKWYMDNNNVWHKPESNETVLPEMHLHF